MKTHLPLRLAGVLALTISLASADSKFSGIYRGKVSTGAKFVAAVTGGGRVLGVDESSENYGDLINPATSTVNKDGKFKGTTANGASIQGKVAKDFTLKGTLKRDGMTYRLNGERRRK